MYKICMRHACWQVLVFIKEATRCAELPASDSPPPRSVNMNGNRTMDAEAEGCVREIVCAACALYLTQHRSQGEGRRQARARCDTPAPLEKGQPVW